MNRIKIAIAACFAVGVVALIAAESLAYPPFVAKARKFGAKDCTFCHVDPAGGPPWNERGKWLIAEKDRRKADIVDVEWLAEYKPNNAAAGSHAPATADQQLTALYNELIDAGKKKNTEPFARILADDFTEITASGQMVNKTAVLESIPNMTIESYTITDVATRLLGDIAVMTFRSTARVTYQGNDLSGEYRESAVWARRDGRWQMVAAQVTRISAK